MRTGVWFQNERVEIGIFVGLLVRSVTSAGFGSVFAIRSIFSVGLMEIARQSFAKQA